MEDKRLSDEDGFRGQDDLDPNEIMDVSFDVNCMVDADDGGVAHLLDSYFPDNIGVLERDPLNAAVKGAESTSVMKLASDDDDGEVAGVQDILDVYGVMCLLPITKSDPLAPMMLRFLNTSGATQIAAHLSASSHPYHIFISDRVQFLPVQLAAQVIVHTLEESLPSGVSLIVYLLKARRKPPPSVVKKKKKNNKVQKRDREEGDSGIVPPLQAKETEDSSTSAEWEFLKPEDEIFYRHRDTAFGEVRIPFPPEYENQPAAEIPFAMPMILRATKLPAVLKEVKTLDAYFDGK